MKTVVGLGMVFSLSVVAPIMAADHNMGTFHALSQIPVQASPMPSEISDTDLAAIEGEGISIISDSCIGCTNVGVIVQVNVSGQLQSIGTTLDSLPGQGAGQGNSAGLTQVIVY